MSQQGQFSLFGAAVAEPTLADLDGVLLAGGWWVRVEGVARLSVVVADRWRADSLAEEFALRGVAAEPNDGLVDAEAGFGVRTGFHRTLNPSADRWSRGANAEPPAEFVLSPGGLRLWAIAAGRRDDVGYLLATALPDDRIHTAGGAQLSRLGLAAVSLAGRGGPGWRITSAKRIRRLSELLGPAPLGAGGAWT
jgi:hypothetical protein